MTHNPLLYHRVDINSEIGWGHFIRTLALAEMLQDNFKPVIVSIGLINRAKYILKQKKIGFIEVQNEESFIKILKGGEKVIVDGYHFKPAYYKNLKCHGAIVISVQDFQISHKNIDLIINHLPEVESDYPKSMSSILLAGPAYAIVRSEFRLSPIKSTTKTDAPIYFISLGGTLNFSLLNKIIRLLRNLAPGCTINVLTTEINAVHIIDANVFYHIGADDIVKLIDDSDFCIITPGMISYEVFFRRKHVIMGSLNKGQDIIAKKFLKLNLVNYIGFWENMTREGLKSNLYKNEVHVLQMEKLFNFLNGRQIIDAIRYL